MSRIVGVVPHLTRTADGQRARRRVERIGGIGAALALKIGVKVTHDIHLTPFGCIRAVGRIGGIMDMQVDVRVRFAGAVKERNNIGGVRRCRQRVSVNIGQVGCLIESRPA